MKYQLIGSQDCPIAEISLNANEKVMIESGAMAYMQEVTLEGKMNSQKSGIGGFLGAIGRSIVSGESIFITTATGNDNNAKIGVAPAIPGKIKELKVGEKQYRLNTGSFLACDTSVCYKMVKQDVGKAIFGGTGGLFVMETEGDGSLLVNSFGDILELEVTEDHPITIDNEHVVAWDKNLNYTIEAASGLLGFKTGEGFVDKFTGNGKILIQTRNISALATIVSRYLPTETSSSSN